MTSMQNDSQKDIAPPVIGPSTPGTGTSGLRSSDIIRLGTVGFVAYWSFDIIAPFALIIVWAAILAVALFPIYNTLRKVLGRTRIIPASLIVIACLVAFIAPLTAIVFSFADVTRTYLTGLQDGTVTVPAPPEALLSVPVLGKYAYKAWLQASVNLEEVATRFQEPLKQFAKIGLERLAALGGNILSFIASVLLAGVFLVASSRLVAAVDALARKIAGKRGSDYLRLASMTVRNVSRGVIGIALLQTILCGLLFSAFDLPAKGAMIFAVFALSILQIGPGLVLLPLVIWVWLSSSVVEALLFTVPAVIIGMLDNVLKPILIARGLSTPMPVLVIGVIGGAVSHGLVGLFLGPVVLAVFYDLLLAWGKQPNENAGEHISS